MTAVAIINKQDIIDKLSQGLRLSDIAPALGVSPNAISKALKSDPDYRTAIEVGFHKRLDEAEDAILKSGDKVDVARARARFQSVAWRAEREFPETWGQKVELHQSVDVRVAIEDARQRTVGIAIDASQLPQRTTAHNEIVDAQVIEDKR